MRNVDLVKETGMIAQFLFKTGRYQVKLVSYNNEQYSNLHLLDSRIEHQYLKKWTGIVLIDTILYFFACAKTINIIQIYHLNKLAVFQAIVFKLINPRVFALN